MGRRALEQFHPGGLFCHFRDKLDGTGAGADHSHGFACQVNVVVPAGAMEVRSLKILNAGEGGIGRLVELACRSNQCLAGENVTIGQSDLPGACIILVAGVGDFGVKANVAIDVVFASAVLLVGKDFLLRGKSATPGVVPLKGVRIQMGRHVTGRTGVGVIAPAAAHIVAFFDQQEIILPLFLETNRHAKTAETGADDDDLMGRAHGVYIPLTVIDTTVARPVAAVYGILGHKIVENGHSHEHPARHHQRTTASRLWRRAGGACVGSTGRFGD